MLCISNCAFISLENDGLRDTNTTLIRATRTTILILFMVSAVFIVNL
ncbi:MAG: hypothetical protein JW720_08110 [Sedimentisphaerales bacterium]|nr:hypothetical protein [Sedimentisphaerales bacterium]